MATKTWYFSGIASWAKLSRPDEKYDRYSIDLYMDKANLAKFRESGAQLKVRSSPDRNDGMEYVTFIRPSKGIRKGVIEEYGPPAVLRNDGRTPLDDDTLVGNGSTCTVKVDVFDTAKGKGSRLVSVRVDELVPYMPRDVDEDIDEPF